MSDSGGKSYKGQCFCGGVQLEATGEPFAMGYCHCKDCRHWSAGPVNAFTLWSEGAVKVTTGAEMLGSYNNSPQSARKFCTKCGGHVFTDHPGDNPFTDVYAAILPDLEFTPALHVNFKSAVLDTSDGLPRYKDFPAEFGGSDEKI